jgi:hypothetical protein
VNDELIQLRARVEQAQYFLLNLLAVIHRDGGHHTIDVGLEQSYLDATTKWYTQLTLTDDLAQALRDNQEIYGGRWSELDTKSVVNVLERYESTKGARTK